MARTTPPPCGIYSNHVQTCRLIDSGLSHGYVCLDFHLGHTNNVFHTHWFIPDPETLFTTLFGMVIPRGFMWTICPNWM